MSLSYRFKQHTLIISVALFLSVFGNISFFSNVLKTYPFSSTNNFFIASLFILLTSLIVLLFSLVSSRYTTKPVLIIILIASAFASYFMNSYGIVLDSDMLTNAVQTNLSESLDLLNTSLILYLLFLGLLPSYLVYKAKLSIGSLKQEVFNKLKLIVSSVVIITLTIFVFSKHYASFFREHKNLRLYTNPVFYVYSVGKNISGSIKTKESPFQHVGHDAEKSANDIDRELVIMVVGETVRADRFSLNGYHKKTNPLLEKENLISFKDMSSCGTSTAISVPCIFSKFTKDEYTKEKAHSHENVLDILSHLGVNVLWRDNNSDSKGVALRVPYEDFRTNKLNTICDTECRDEGMLVGLQEYINKQKGDILIVLHQMGNHGPAYYKRYPDKFKKFTPTCDSKNLEKCTQLQINNSYDNAIVYTDYFLAQTIKLLKNNSSKFETALLYVSDHGESLGENGIYLHGLPSIIAPKEQTHVASIFWAGKHMEVDKLKLKAKENQPVSHDNIFHILLGIFEVKTEVYDRDMDIIDYLDNG